MSYAIVTDSTCGIPFDMAAQLKLTVLPLAYFIDGVEHCGFFPDKPINLKGFYESMRAGSSVRTSLPNPKESMETIRGILATGRDVLYLGCSEGLSGTFGSVKMVCEQLAEEFPERTIRCICTASSSYGEGVLVKKAALKALAGESLEQVAAWATEVRMHINHWFTVDDLSFALGGGRMARTGAFAANMLDLKPILRLDEEGKVDIYGKTRGRKRSFKHIVAEVKAHLGEGFDDEIVIAHGDCPEEAEKLREMISQETGATKFSMEYLDPVVGCHGGPGAVAVFFQGLHR